MEPPSPQPDIPDPDSPIPESAPAAPDAGGNAVGKVSRIRSRPVMGERAGLPGAYVVDYGEDMNWRRGVVVLWALFGLAMLGEIVNGAFYLLAGYTGWPLRYEMVRVVVGALVFLSLWIGLGWTRWLLVAVDFLSGVSLILWGIVSHVSTRMPSGMVQGGPVPDTAIEAMPKIGLGLVYLATAAYLAFSADMIDFIRHRREKGRGWVIAPITLLVTAYMGLVATMGLPYNVWISLQSSAAKRFGEDTVRTMASGWEPNSLVDRSDATFLENWYENYRVNAFATMLPLGQLQDIGELNFIPGYTVVHPATGRFTMQYSYNLRQARFAHGNADVGLLIVKPLFGRWQIDDLQIRDVKFDSASAGKPASTPVPTPAPTP